jgi:hypothetical protein
VTCSNSPNSKASRPAAANCVGFLRTAPECFGEDSISRSASPARPPPRDKSRVDTQRERRCTRPHDETRLVTGGRHRTGHWGVLRIRVSGRGADGDTRHSDAATTENWPGPGLDALQISNFYIFFVTSNLYTYVWSIKYR